jgi:hypothetical protein
MVREAARAFALIRADSSRHPRFYDPRGLRVHTEPWLGGEARLRAPEPGIAQRPVECDAVAGQIANAKFVLNYRVAPSALPTRPAFA